MNVMDQPIMFIFLPIMLCSSAQIFYLLCSILCSCKRFVLKNLAVLLEYIHLHHKNFNVVIVLLENIKSSTHYSCTNNNHNGCSIRVY